jgi:hypothetical protein
MRSYSHLAPKELRRKLGVNTAGKRCECGNLCHDDHYQCALCAITKMKKKRKTVNAKNHHAAKLRRSGK